MLLSPLDVAGAYLVELEPKVDERGFFARTFCEDEFRTRGLTTRFPHTNLSRNTARGTLRGMHYTVSPSQESKLVRCTAGAIYDVLLDVRSDSPTFAKWATVELSRENARAVFIPAGVAHGFLTLLGDTDVFYQMGDIYRAETARGLRWNDETFGLGWPFAPSVISERDASYPRFAAAAP
jgi:dTDP-4-dehydrorhamnose 3,5-epimerase